MNFSTKAHDQKGELFEAVLKGFVAQAKSRPPPSVYQLHPAHEPVTKALLFEYREVNPEDEDWARREADEDAARLLHYVTRTRCGALLYDGLWADDPDILGEIADIKKLALNQRIRDRNTGRSYGDPPCCRPLSDLMRPTQSEQFLAVANVLIGHRRPKAADKGALCRAYDALRASYFPSPEDLTGSVRWGSDDAEMDAKAAEVFFYNAMHSLPRNWKKEIEALTKIKKEEKAMDNAKLISPKRSLRLVPVGQLEAQEPDYLIDGLIETDCTVTIFGDPGCGKSFLSLDMALCVATCTPFHGRAVQQGTVVYLAGEGLNGLKRRADGWFKRHGLVATNPPLFISNKAPQLLNQASMEELGAVIGEIVADHGMPKLVFVDTVARAFGGGDENSTKDMTAFVAALDAIRAKLRCTIVLVHHSGHGDKQRARGSMALKGAVDAEYRVEKKGKRVTVENHKMKDAPPPPTMQFQLDEVVLGRGKSGTDITTAVLRETAHFDEDRPKKMTANQQLGFDTYEETVLQHGTLQDDGGFAGISVDAWREEFYRRHTGDNIGAKKKAFQRAREDLVKLGRFKVDNDIYRPDGDFPAIDEARYVEVIKNRDTGQ